MLRKMIGQNTWLVLTLLYIHSTLTCLADDLFSSTVHLADGLDAEKRLTHLMWTYLDRAEARLEHIKYQRDQLTEALQSGKVTLTGADDMWVSETPTTERNSQDFSQANHPIAALTLISRHSNWKGIHNNIRDYSFADELFAEINKIVNKTKVSDDDLDNARRSLVKLQDVYMIPAADLVSGEIHDSKALTGITRRNDIKRMIELSLDMGMYRVAQEWVEQSYKKLKKNDMEGYMELLWLEKMADRGLSMIDPEADDEVFTDGQDDPDFENTIFYIQIANQERFAKLNAERKRLNGKHVFPLLVKPDWWEDYEQLCRGKKMKPRKGVRLSHECILKPSKNPFIFYRKEVVANFPYVVIYHDFISDHEGNEIKELAAAGLDISRSSSDSSKMESLSNRISQYMYIKDGKQTQTTRRIEKRISDVTYLDAENSAEHLQVNIYGMGGYYEPHYDFYGDAQKFEPGRSMGDRIATFMIYLNSVEAGGATVFPYTRLAVRPQKNAAVFWYNLRPDGSQDHVSLHAGCPVLLGHKWVVNKWIHERGQAFNRPVFAGRASQAA